MRNSHRAGAVLVILAASVARLAPLLACVDTCFVDFDRFLGPDAALIYLHEADTRLNAWILGWVQHALTSSPASIYDANVFHPSPGILAGSEHLIGVATLLLPLRLMDVSAVTLHQTALFVSFALTGVSTYALVRWLTGSTTAALFSGVAAVVMPWRLSELSHVQLLGTSFIPLVWLLCASVCSAEAPRKRQAAALFAATLVQLLSSYYLAYFLLFSLVVLGLVLVAQRRLSVRAAVFAACPLAAALAVFALVSLPYLVHGQPGELALKGYAPTSSTVAAAWASIAPYGPFGAGSSLPWRGGYATPPLVLLFALLSLPAAFSRRPSAAGDPAQGRAGRLETLTRMLWLSALGAFILSLGTHLDIAGWRLPLPGHWAADWLPGFADMRRPLRWGILIGLVLPVLAGIGLHHLRTTLARAARGLPLLVPASTAVVAVLLVASVPWPRLPTTPVIPAAEAKATTALYRQLARLPSAPLLEVPWPRQASRDAVLASRYMLASTRHWHPLLNGYTAWTPPNYDFLRRLGQRLPRRDALEALRRLTGLKWIVVHSDEMTVHELDPWDGALINGTLLAVWGNEHARIYEINVDAEPYAELDAIVSPQPRPLTINSLSREKLALAPESGLFEVRLSGPLTPRLFGNDWLKTWLPVRIVNNTDQPWPGVDPSAEGLLALAYEFVDAEGRSVLEGRASLDADVAAGTAVDTQVIVEGHLTPGRYRLYLTLVQQIGTEILPLPLGSPVVEVYTTPHRRS